VGRVLRGEEGGRVSLRRVETDRLLVVSTYDSFVEPVLCRHAAGVLVAHARGRDPPADDTRPLALDPAPVVEVAALARRREKVELLGRAGRDLDDDRGRRAVRLDDVRPEPEAEVEGRLGGEGRQDELALLPGRLGGILRREEEPFSRCPLVAPLQSGSTYKGHVWMSGGRGREGRKGTAAGGEMVVVGLASRSAERAPCSLSSSPGSCWPGSTDKRSPNLLLPVRMGGTGRETSDLFPSRVCAARDHPGNQAGNTTVGCCCCC
jgi:hypothetical protein